MARTFFLTVALLALAAPAAAGAPTLQITLSATGYTGQVVPYEVSGTSDARMSLEVFVRRDRGGCAATPAAQAERPWWTRWEQTARRGSFSSDELQLQLLRPGRYLVCAYLHEDARYDSAAATAQASIELARPAGCIVPDVRGLSRGQARDVLIAANCWLGRTTLRPKRKPRLAPDEFWAVPAVRRQSERPGTELPAGTAVHLMLRRMRVVVDG